MGELALQTRIIATEYCGTYLTAFVARAVVSTHSSHVTFNRPAHVCHIAGRVNHNRHNRTCFEIPSGDAKLSPELQVKYDRHCSDSRETHTTTQKMFVDIFTLILSKSKEN